MAKILIVTGIFPPDIGGPATYVPKIAEGLRQRGHEVRVLTTSEPEDLDSDDEGYAFPVFRMNRRTRLWRRPFYYMRHILRHGRDVDVIYANGVFLETALANLWLRKPLVMKIVGDEAWERATRRGWTRDGFEAFQRRRQSWQAELFKRVRTWSVKQADRIITPSRYLQQVVANWGVPKERIHVVYNAFELPERIDPQPIPLQTPFKVVTVGRLLPLKQIDGILEAVARISEVGLVIIGDGPERFHLEQLAEKMAIAERVYFAGKLNHAHTLGVMANCDIFVLNSTHEGLPHVVLEAMALGLPVVATAVGGTPEVVKNGHNGFLIPPGDNAALRGVLRKLLASEALREQVGRAAREDAKRFHFNYMIEATEALFRK